jgi:ArsR family transcriptional regulator
MKALGDSNRFRIAMMLLERPMCVCELLEVLDIAGGTLSSHLNVLKNAGLISQRKDGKWVEYYIKEAKADQLLRSIESFLSDKDQIQMDRDLIGSITRFACSSKSSKGCE